MIRFNVKTTIFALVTICAFSVLLPAESFATLNDMVCRALNRGCIARCGTHGSEECFAQCDDDLVTCQYGGSLTTKRQNPAPPPCKGIHCALRPPPKTTDPTAPRRPITTAKPTAPFKPVGNSNPSGPSNPVIFERRDESGGHGHGK